MDDADPVEGNTPLMEAACCGNTEVVRELVRNTARSPHRPWRVG
eukprot:COSAG02_NODE_680_length_18551_cov_16.648060_18_plen_44_part_00